MRYWPLIFCLSISGCMSLSGDNDACRTGTNELLFPSRVLDKPPTDGTVGEVGARAQPTTPAATPEEGDDADEDEDTTVYLSPRNHDFGTVKAGEELKLTLEVVRPEGAPLRLGRVMASCSCVTVSAPKRVFTADEKALVFVTVNPKASKIQQSYSVTAEILNDFNSLVQTGLYFVTE